MDKQSVINEVIAHLDAELLRYANAARVAHAEATDEQSKAENKYDTRGLEASYLAHGQSRQVLETEQARELFLTLQPRVFANHDPVGLGALVLLAGDRDECWYFLAPAAGGTDVVVDGSDVLVITAQSPMGRLLCGSRRGEQIQLGREVYRVLEVL